MNGGAYIGISVMHHMAAGKAGENRTDASSDASSRWAGRHMRGQSKHRSQSPDASDINGGAQVGIGMMHHMAAGKAGGNRTDASSDASSRWAGRRVRGQSKHRSQSPDASDINGGAQVRIGVMHHMVAGKAGRNRTDASSDASCRWAGRRVRGQIKH